MDMIRAMNNREVAVAFCKENNPYVFRSGEYAEVVGVRMVKPDGLDWRLCYLVRFEDGEQDLWPVHDEDANRTFVPSTEIAP